MLDPAYHLEQHLDQHAPDASIVSLSVADDGFLHSFDLERWRLGIPLSSDG